MKLNLYEDVLAKQTIDADQYSADANGTAIDTLGYSNAMAVCSVGDVDGADTDETYTLKIQESANGSSGWADITGSSVAVALDGDNNVYVLDIPGIGTDRERYLRAVVDVGGTTPAIDVGIVILLGQAFRAPVTQDN